MKNVKIIRVKRDLLVVTYYYFLRSFICHLIKYILYSIVIYYLVNYFETMAFEK